jgi:hypothetical protein
VKLFWKIHPWECASTGTVPNPAAGSDPIDEYETSTVCHDTGWTPPSVKTMLRDMVVSDTKSQPGLSGHPGMETTSSSYDEDDGTYRQQLSQRNTDSTPANFGQHGFSTAAWTATSAGGTQTSP